MNRRDIIQKEYRDSDGYWIDLKPGWQNGNDPGTHGIVESTKRDAYSTLTMAKPCNCASCQKEIERIERNAEGDADQRAQLTARIKEMRRSMWTDAEVQQAVAEWPLDWRRLVVCQVEESSTSFRKPCVRSCTKITGHGGQCAFSSWRMR